jgi:hypothetical protein
LGLALPVKTIRLPEAMITSRCCSKDAKKQNGQAFGLPAEFG